MPPQLATAQTPITIVAAATGTDLATAPTVDAASARNVQARNGILLIMPVGGAATLAAPSILVRRRGTSNYYDVGAIDRLTGGDLVLAAGVGRAISVRDWLAWGDRLWVRSATITGAGSVNILFVPLETYE